MHLPPQRAVHSSAVLLPARRSILMSCHRLPVYSSFGTDLCTRLNTKHFRTDVRPGLSRDILMCLSARVSRIPYMLPHHDNFLYPYIRTAQPTQKLTYKYVQQEQRQPGQVIQRGQDCHSLYLITQAGCASGWERGFTAPLHE